MCDPVTTSLMIASAGASYAGNRKSQKAMEGTVAEENARQQRFRDQQKGVLDVSTKARSASKTKEQIAIEEAKANTNADAAMKANTAGADSAPTAVAPSAASSANVEDSYSREDARAGARSTQDAGRKAALDAFSNTMTAQQINNTKYAQDSAVLANMSQGSLGVLPYELQAASKAGDGLKTLSQVLSLASIYSGYQAGIGKPLGAASWGDLFNPEVANAAAPAATTFASPALPMEAAKPASLGLDAAGDAVISGGGGHLNSQYVTLPPKGTMGPPVFNQGAAVRGGFVNQNGSFVGGTNTIKGALMNPYKHRIPIR
jgi:hypothetical protein